jgi:ribulose-phosphate 3-epimerase
MIKIAPSILAADFARLGEEIKAAESAGADMIHLDIMDGHFVPNLSFGEEIAAMSKTACRLPHDAHLMVTAPEYYIESFARTGVEYITFHLEIEGTRQDLGPGRWVYVIERVVNPERVIKIISAIKKAGCKPGLSLNPPTMIELVFPFLSEIDLLLLMSVNPGFAG